MNNQEKENRPLCECETCCKEILKSEAITAEGMDYVYYFCGAECYQKWMKESKLKSDKESKK